MSFAGVAALLTALGASIAGVLSRTEVGSNLARVIDKISTGGSTDRVDHFRQSVAELSESIKSETILPSNFVIHANLVLDEARSVNRSVVDMFEREGGNSKELIEKATAELERLVTLLSSIGGDTDPLLSNDPVRNEKELSEAAMLLRAALSLARDLSIPHEAIGLTPEASEKILVASMKRNIQGYEREKATAESTFHESSSYGSFVNNAALLIQRRVDQGAEGDLGVLLDDVLTEVNLPLDAASRDSLKENIKTRLVMMSHENSPPTNQVSAATIEKLSPERSPFDRY